MPYTCKHAIPTSSCKVCQTEKERTKAQDEAAFWKELALEGLDLITYALTSLEKELKEAGLFGSYREFKEDTTKALTTQSEEIKPESTKQAITHK